MLCEPIAHHVEHRGLVAVVVCCVAVPVIGRMDNHLLRDCKGGDDRADSLCMGLAIVFSFGGIGIKITKLLYKIFLF